MKVNSLHINAVKVLLIGLPIAIVITKLGYANKDVFLLFGIVVCCVILFFWSYNSAYRQMIRLFTIFLVLHLIVFPFIYLGLLKSNSKNFEFDTAIHSSEKEASLAAINFKYSPIESQKKVDILTRILNSTYSILDTAFSFLSAGNLIVLEDYVINIAHELNPPPPGDMPAAVGPYIYITDRNGLLVTTFDKVEGINFNSVSKKVRQLLEQLKTYYANRKNDFTKNARRITEKNDIWSYRGILSYSINISFTSNMVPKTRVANMLFFLHYLIVVIFLLGIIVGVFQNTILNRNNSS